MRLLIGLMLLTQGCDLFFPGDKPAQYAELCVDTAMCANGLSCSQENVCRYPGEPGTGEVGQSCLNSAQCAATLVCSAQGMCAAEGDPGTAGHGETCAESTDCRAGLTCEGLVCVGLEAPFWPGTDCPDPALESGDFRVFFEIPGDEPLSDFYRLPFPNDARRDDSGNINLNGHPAPGALVDVVGDVVGNVIRTIETDTHAFGNNQAVFLRFSASPDFETLTLGLPGTGNVALVDLTPGPTYGTIPPFAFETHTERTTYLCHNWLAAYPLDGAPLRPGHTYGLLVTRDVTDEFGNHAAQDPDFTVLVGAESPGTGRLGHPWERYAPLRAWLSSAGISPDQLSAAAVFTTEDPSAEVERLRVAVAAEPVPEVAGLTLCGTGADLYADPADPTRGCQTASDGAFIELQGTVTLPQYQEGAPPFKDAVDGGAIDLERRLITPLRQEAVHITLTVPADVPMPQAGWPVVVYGHGTGGNYTGAVRDGLADLLTGFTAPDGTPVAFATLTFDAPLHGPRANPAAWKQAWLDVDPHAYDPDVLFFNPLNPRAARDNALQEAADLWSLVKAARAFDIAAGSSPTGQRLRLDKNHVFYLGHSQGAVVGPLFLGHEPEVTAAVLAAGGALTIESLLHKTSPHNLPAMIAVGLADPYLTRVHPILNLTQQLAERTDGVNHAGFVQAAPIGDDPRRNVFQIYGIGDTYSPDSTQSALARALDLDQFTNGTSPLPKLDTVFLPASDNRGGITAVVGTYTNTGEDAHFVLFDRADAQAHVQSFFGSALTADVPTIVPL